MRTKRVLSQGVQVYREEFLAVRLYYSQDEGFGEQETRSCLVGLNITEQVASVISVLRS